MPPLSRWFIKSSLLYLVATFVAGIVEAVARADLAPAYYHLFMLGWVSQLIFGVANWMFPVYSREAPRRSERLGWATYWLLNGGLLLLVGGYLVPETAAPWLRLAGALLLWLAGSAFVVNTWSRVRGR